MNKSHIKEAYQKIGANFMTPNVLRYEIVNNRIIELSKGTGFEGNTIYGVTEFVYEDAVLSTTKRGQMHTDKKSALKHYNSLIKETESLLSVIKDEKKSAEWVERAQKGEIMRII